MKTIAQRINSINDQEAKCLLANLQGNKIPPYRLHTHPTDFVIHTFGVDCGKSGMINSEKSETVHAMRELGMHRVREIAYTVYMHPTLGEDALTAMLDGKRVIINVDRLTKPVQKRASATTMSSSPQRNTLN